MNYFQFHIGDYASATRHLSWDEDMAYRRLLDAYYMREGPLPADLKQVCRLIQATSRGQREAVDTVLREFFELADDGWHNGRADDELELMEEKRRKAKSSARTRWHNANADSTAPQSHSEGNADVMRTHSEGNAPNTNTNTNTNTNSDDVMKRARDLELRLREAAGWQNEPAPMLAVTGPIEALIANGADLETDVLPVIAALAPRVKSRTNWNYFVKPIADARDRRIETSTVVSSTTSSPRPNHETRQRKPTRDETFAAIDRRIDELRQAECRETDGGQAGNVEPPQRTT